MSHTIYYITKDLVIHLIFIMFFVNIAIWIITKESLSKTSQKWFYFWTHLQLVTGLYISCNVTSAYPFKAPCASPSYVVGFHVVSTLFFVWIRRIFPIFSFIYILFYSFRCIVYIHRLYFIFSRSNVLSFLCIWVIIDFGISCWCLIEKNS